MEGSNPLIHPVGAEVLRHPAEEQAGAVELAESLVRLSALSAHYLDRANWADQHEFFYRTHHNTRAAQEAAQEAASCRRWASDLDRVCNAASVGGGAHE